MTNQICSICFLVRGKDALKQLAIKKIAKANNYKLEIKNYEELLNEQVRLEILNNKSFDFIMLPLSLPNFFSLNLAEEAHLLNSKCRLLLYSGTRTPKSILLKMFDGFISDIILPKELKDEISRISKIKINRIKTKNKLKEAIKAILSTASCFGPSGNHIGISTYEDYRKRLRYEDKNGNNKHPDQVGGPVHQPISLFYSYSRKDESYRNQLEEHLSSLKKEGYINTWHDRKIAAGKEWEGEINKNLAEANIILLLISSSFLASDYCYDLEMETAMKRHMAKVATVIPIIIREVDWQSAPFSKLQVLPADAKAVSSWANIDEAWKSVSIGIREVVHRLRGY